MKRYLISYVNWLSYSEYGLLINIVAFFVIYFLQGSSKLFFFCSVNVKKMYYQWYIRNLVVFLSNILI